MLHKTFEVIDAKADGETGTFEATVAVFGNVDSGGDRIIPGAFTKTLDKWRATGDPIPVILSHQHENPMAHVGYAMPADVKQTPKGLRVKGTLDIADNEVAKQVHKLMRRRSLKEFSFGYRVPQGGEKRAADGANDLSEIDLIEVGPTLKGMNADTELHGVKSALAEAEAEPRDEKTLRKASDQLERDRQAAKLVKADGDVEEAEDDTLETVLELLADFLETEDDADDIAAAKEIMLRVQALINSEEAEPSDEPSPVKSEAELRRQTGRLERSKQAKQLAAPAPFDVNARLEEAQEALVALEAFNPIEVKGVHENLLKAAWTTAYVNSLPDSSFLYIEPGAAKDADGKTTPRSKRHFPYKDEGGAVDLPHLRNALARIPQSNLSQSVKDTLTARAERVLADQKSEAVVQSQEPTRARSADPLRKRSLEVVLDIQSDGMSARKSPQVEEPPAAPDGPSEAELRRRSRDQMLAILTGTEQ